MPCRRFPENAKHSPSSKVNQPEDCKALGLAVPTQLVKVIEYAIASDRYWPPADDGERFGTTAH